MTNIQKIQISVVSYTNTLPFRIAMETSPALQKQADITYDTPEQCAHKLISKQSDIGLVPVGALPFIDKYHIVSNYCIGAYDSVDSVKLYGQVPVEKMEKIVLDYQSWTSTRLMRVLAEEYWNIKVQFLQGKPGFEQTSIANNVGAVVIGDRTFELNHLFPYEYDLAHEWYEFTGLPFVFAVWVGRDPIPESFENLFNSTLHNGITRIETIADQFKEKVSQNIDLKYYLTRNIDYTLDVKKRKAMNMFLSFVSRLKSVNTI